jgi:hypothetical protein
VALQNVVIMQMNIRSKIIRLSENNLREIILIPLLNALGAYGVQKFHGSSEKGKDVYFAYKDLFGEHKHCCFFIKIGDIKKSGKNDIRKMKGHIEEAIQREFINPIDNKIPIYIEEFYFVCSGKINQEARDYITDLLRHRQMPNLRIFDIDKLTQAILELIKRYKSILKKNYIFNTQSFSKYCNHIRDYEDKRYIMPIRDYKDKKPTISVTSHIEGKIIQDHE